MPGKLPSWAWALIALLVVVFIVKFVVGAILLALKVAAVLAVLGGAGYVALKVARRQ